MVIDLKKTTISIQDGSGTPLSIEVSIGEGNLTYSEKRPIEYVKDKGVLDTARLGDEEPMDVRFEFRWDYLTGSTTTGLVPSVEDALKGVGAAQDWVSSSVDGCEPYAVDITIEFDPTTDNASCEGDTETITLRDFRWESLEHDAKAGTVSCSGRCNATTAEVVRTA